MHISDWKLLLWDGTGRLLPVIIFILLLLLLLLLFHSFYGDILISIQ